MRLWQKTIEPERSSVREVAERERRWWLTARGLGTERVIFRSHALLLQSYRGVDMAPRKFF